MPASAGMTDLTLSQSQTLHESALIQFPDDAVVENLFRLHVFDPRIVAGGEIDKGFPAAVDGIGGLCRRRAGDVGLAA